MPERDWRRALFELAEDIAESPAELSEKMKQEAEAAGDRDWAILFSAAGEIKTNPDACLETLAPLLERSPKNALARLVQAEAAWELKDKDLLQEAVEDLPDKPFSPDDPDAYIQARRIFHSAHITHLENDTEKTITLNRGLSNILPAEGNRLYTALLAKALFNMGVDFHVAGRLDEAIKDYEQVVERFGNSSDKKLMVWVAKALYNMGIDLEHAGRIDEAIKANDQVVERFGNSPDRELMVQVGKAFLGNALAHNEKGNIAEAQDSFRQAESRLIEAGG